MNEMLQKQLKDEEEREKEIKVKRITENRAYPSLIMVIAEQEKIGVAVDFGSYKLKCDLFQLRMLEQDI